jgi:hypothetical protein
MDGGLSFDEALRRYRLAQRALADHMQGFRPANNLPDLDRELFSAMADLLRHHAAGTGELPSDVAASLADLLGYISIGQLPGPIKDATAGRGNRGIGPTEESDIRCGCVYIAAVKARMIDDRHPKTTVKKAYSVTLRAVMRWVERYRVMDVDLKRDPDDIEREMRAAGAAYSRDGRSTDAVRSRDARNG